MRTLRNTQFNLKAIQTKLKKKLLLEKCLMLILGAETILACFIYILHTLRFFFFF